MLAILPVETPFPPGGTRISPLVSRAPPCRLSSWRLGTRGLLRQGPGLQARCSSPTAKQQREQPREQHVYIDMYIYIYMGTIFSSELDSITPSCSKCQSKGSVLVPPLLANRRVLS